MCQCDVVMFCICFLCVMSLAVIRTKAGCGDAAGVRYSFVLPIVFILFVRVMGMACSLLLVFFFSCMRVG